MTDIEEVVRRALGEQVYRQPPMTDSADRAIAGARAVRRRQVALSVGAVVVALLATVAGVAALHGRGTGPVFPPSNNDHLPASPVPPRSPAPSSTDAARPPLPETGLGAVIDQRSLLLPDGRLLPIAPFGDDVVVNAYQIGSGWLVERFGDGTPDSGTLWLYHADGSAVRLIDHETGVLVSPDGTRLAWRVGHTVTVAHLDAADNLVRDGSTTVDNGYPLMFAGSALVLGYSATGGGTDHWDVWVPQHGRFVPDWNAAQAAGVSAVYAATRDGRWLIGQALTNPGTGSKDDCLARLDPLDHLKVVARACGLPEAGEWGVLSPDGHWLAYSGIASAQLVVVDATTVFQQPRVAATFDNAGGPVWTGPDTLVALLSNGPGAPRYYRYQVGQPTGEEVGVPGTTAHSTVELVPKLS
jgi:hypothetical protein